MMRQPEPIASTVGDRLYDKQEGAKGCLDVSNLVAVCYLKVS